MNKMITHGKEKDMVNTNENEEILSNKLWIICAVIFAIILTPSIRFAGIPGFRIEQLIIVVFLIYVCFKFRLIKKVKDIDLKFPVMYLGFSFFIILSILVGFIKGVQVVMNDFFELYKIFIYLGIYFITVSTIVCEEDKLKIIRFINICILLSLVIAVQQYFDLFNLNEKYVHIIAPTQFRTLVNNYPYPRVVGMTGNPNEYSVMPGIGAILSWSIYLITKEKKQILYMIIFIIGTLLTLSRSGFIFMISGIIIFALLYLLKVNLILKDINKWRINLKGLKTIIFPIIILILIVFIIFNYLPEELTWRLMSGINIKSDSSFQARISNWEEHINYFKSSPLFGLGPAKSIEYKKSVDNEWLLFLRRYGIIGTFYIVLVFTIPFIKSKDKKFKYIYFSVLFGSVLYMIPSIIYHSFQLMPLIIILAGLVSTNKKEDTLKKYI